MSCVICAKRFNDIKRLSGIIYLLTIFKKVNIPRGLFMSSNYCVDELSEDSIKKIFDYTKYINPYKWQKEHFKTHDNGHSLYSDGRVAICKLPFEYVLSDTSIGSVAFCRCTICGEKYDMVNYDYL